LTNNVVSNLEIRDLLKAVIANVRQIMRSDFASVGLPDSDSGPLRVYAFAFAGDGNFSETEMAPAEDTVPFRVFRNGKLWAGNVEDLPETQGEQHLFPSTRTQDRMRSSAAESKSTTRRPAAR
jgi:hypothetical protein